MTKFIAEGDAVQGQIRTTVEDVEPGRTFVVLDPSQATETFMWSDRTAMDPQGEELPVAMYVGEGAPAADL